MTFRRRFDTELSENPLSTEIYFSKKSQNNTVQTLQTIMQFFLGQCIRRDITVIDEYEELEEQASFGSTASTLLGLKNPTLKPAKRLQPRRQNEFNPSLA